VKNCLPYLGSYEFSLIALPLNVMISQLCEQAGQPVLALSIEKAVVDGTLESLVRAIWLTDIQAGKGGAARKEFN
jgi:hypothetical protein